MGLIDIYSTINQTLYNDLLMNIIVENYDLDEDIEKLNECLLSDNDSVVSIIDDLDDDQKIEEESNEISNDVNNLLDVDSIIDKLEDEDSSNDDDDIINIKLKDNAPVKLRAQVSRIDDDEENINDNSAALKLHLKDNKSKLNLDLQADEEFNVNLIPEKKIDVNVKPQTQLNINVNDDEEKQLNLKLKSADNNTINLKLKNDEDLDTISVKLKDNRADNNNDSDPNVIRVKLTNTDPEEESDITQFIKKRDELLQSKDPNLMLSSCLKIIVSLKKSLEKLIVHIPNEIILVKTKYLIGDMLDQIVSNNKAILANEEKLKDIIYKVFSLVISINSYINDKYTKLEDNLDQQTKDKENIDIKNSIKDANEKIINDKETNKFNDDNGVQAQYNENEYKRPNINKKRI